MIRHHVRYKYMTCKSVGEKYINSLHKYKKDTALFNKQTN